ncbi:MAG: AMP-binding protein [Candidatus Alcyoniella australis]|nr:AMP-binding protein [Candidatus Alcyoniella australis]
MSKQPEPWLVDYDATVASFDWDDAWAGLRADGASGRPDSVNIADLAVDRHVRDGHGDRVALRFLGRERSGVDEPVDITYAMLSRRTNRFADAMRRRGFDAGTGVATLAGRIPDLYVTALGTLKAHGVFTPLFSAFGPDPIAQRMNLGRIKILVTTPLLYRRKVARMLDRLPHLELVLVCGSTEDEIGVNRNGGGGPQVMSFGAFLSEGDDSFEIAPTDPETPALLHFTSGTTGQPKGALHVHAAVVAHHVTGRLVLDLHDGDTFWCTADPGWVTGTSYGIIAPLTSGVTSIVDEAEFDPERWYRILEHHAVDVFYTAPTAIRMLQRAGSDLAAATDLSHLRLVASVGEPLDAEAVHWCQQTFGVPVIDTWWQTETGGIMISPLPGAIDIKPGSATVPFFGVKPAVIREDGTQCDVNEGGYLVIEEPWPGLMRTVYGQHERFKETYFSQFKGKYFTGDGARVDEDGYYWLMGRVDDVINVSGHRMGTAEIESALVSHPKVAEAAVVGYPHEIKGQGIYAYVTVNADVTPDDDLRKELVKHVRTEIGPIATPDKIHFTDSLPKTRSGKIMRRILKKIAAGALDELGDISTLADPSVVDSLIETAKD